MKIDLTGRWWINVSSRFCRGMLRFDGDLEARAAFDAIRQGDVVSVELGFQNTSVQRYDRPTQRVATLFDEPSLTNEVVGLLRDLERESDIGVSLADAASQADFRFTDRSRTWLSLHIYRELWLSTDLPDLDDDGLTGHCLLTVSLVLKRDAAIDENRKRVFFNHRVEEPQVSISCHPEGYGKAGHELKLQTLATARQQALALVRQYGLSHHRGPQLLPDFQQ